MEPSRYKRPVTKTWGQLKTHMEYKEHQLDTFSNVQDIDAVPDASASIEEYTDKLSTLFKSLTKTMKNWSTEISEIDDPTNQVTEQQIRDDYLKDQKLDFLILETEVSEFVESVENTVKRKIKNLKLREEVNCMKEQRQAQLDAFNSQAAANLAVIQSSPPSSRDNSFSPLNYTGQQVTAPRLTLPALELPLFSGVTHLYPPFIEQFNAIIHENDELTKSQKHRYLRQSLRGDAKQTVAHIQETGDRYEETLNLLKAAYDQPLVSAVTLTDKLHNLTCNNSVPDQLRMAREAMAIIRDIKVVCPNETFQVIQVNLIRKFSDDIQQKVFKQLAGCDPPTLIKLLDDIEKRLMAKQMIRTIQGDKISEQRGIPITGTKYPPKSQQPNKYSNNAQAPRSISSPSQPQMCVYCNEHPQTDTGECRKVPLESRFNYLREHKICTKCLRTGHPFLTCQAKCSKCRGRHHASLCNPTKTTTPPATGSNSIPINNPRPIPNPTNNAQSVLSIDTVHESVLVKPTMLTGRVEATNPITKKRIEVDYIVDPGAMPTLLSEEMAIQLQVPIVDQKTINIGCFGGVVIGSRQYDIAELTIQHKDFQYTIRPVIFKGKFVREIHKQKLSTVDRNFVMKQRIILSDKPNRQGTINPQLLLGNADAMYIMRKSNGRILALPSGLTLLPSALGYLVGGKPDSTRTTTNHDKEPEIQINFISINDIDSRIDRFLSLDEAGTGIETTEKETKRQMDLETDRFFYNTIRKEGSRYVVKYRLKDNWKELPDNKALAIRRLESAIRKLQKENISIEFYDKIIKDQLQAGQIEPVDETRSTSPFLIHYLAHKPVPRRDKPTTPVRIVYDASACMKNKMSLNDVIYQGPSSLEQIPALLLRCRSKPNLILADVEKAFLQVSVDESQRDMLRFLWLKDITKGVTRDNMITYRFTVTPFGINQSPYILGKVIQYHLQNIDTDDPIELYIIAQLQRNLYVDNFLLSTDEVCPEYYTTAKKLFSDMGMNLREFISNDPKFNDFIPERDRGSEIQKILGIKYCSNTDSFNLTAQMEADITCKRDALSEVMSQYDPLGLFQPVQLESRLFVQKLWRNQYKWDDKITETEKNEWKSIQQRHQGFSINVPRYISLYRSEPSATSTIHLVTFSDASASAMGACVYSASDSPDHPKRMRLLVSRSKLAPANRKSTIPKLELDAFILGFNLIQYTIDALIQEHPNAQFQVHPYCDNTTVIHWLTGERTYDLGPYVSNRVKKYKHICNSYTGSPNVVFQPVRYVGTKDNPADHLTRGLTMTAINDPNHQWWTGPDWISGSPETWPQSILPEHHDETTIMLLSFECEPQEVVTPQKTPEPEVIDTSRFSSLDKLCNTTVKVNRFLQYVRSRDKSILRDNPITSEERRRALMTLIRMHQSNNFVQQHELVRKKCLKQDKFGVWRGDNRKIENVAGLNSNPIFLPGKNTNLIKLIAQDIHINLCHAGKNTVVNEIKREYWIPRVQSAVKRMLKDCTTCKKANNRPYKYPAPIPLPDERVNHVRPFECTGIDYIGPFRNIPNENTYILLLTCFTTRAVHLEVVNSMSTVSFLLAFKRFVSRRGMPSLILSDKATTFRTANEVLQQNVKCLQSRVEKDGIKWKFTTAHSPWQGGIYERLVGCVKQAMTKSFGRRKLSPEEFNTLTCEAEGSVNSRPLCYSGSDDSANFNSSVIRPIDFICLNSSLCLRLDTSNDSYIPPSEITTRDQVLKQLHRNEEISEKITSSWVTSYIASLRDSTSKNPLQSYAASASSPTVGEVVLIVDESGINPRSCWPMAIITKIAGHNLTLRTSGGRLIERPHNLVIPLEITNVNSDSPSQSVSDQNVIVPNEPSITDGERRTSEEDPARSRPGDRRGRSQRGRAKEGSRGDYSSNLDESSEVTLDVHFLCFITQEDEQPIQAILTSQEEQQLKQNTLEQQLEEILNNQAKMSKDIESLAASVNTQDQSMKNIAEALRQVNQNVLDFRKDISDKLEQKKEVEAPRKVPLDLDIPSYTPSPKIPVKRASETPSYNHARTASWVKNHNNDPSSHKKPRFMNPCLFCGECTHRHHTCRIMKSRHVRLGIILQKRLCHTCLHELDDHDIKKCQTKTCSECQGDHHEVLCPRFTIP